MKPSTLAHLRPGDRLESADPETGLTLRAHVVAEIPSRAYPAHTAGPRLLCRQGRKTSNYFHLGPENCAAWTRSLSK